MPAHAQREPTSSNHLTAFAFRGRRERAAGDVHRRPYARVCRRTRTRCPLHLSLAGFDTHRPASMRTARDMKVRQIRRRPTRTLSSFFHGRATFLLHTGAHPRSNCVLPLIRDEPWAHTPGFRRQRMRTVGHQMNTGPAAGLPASGSARAWQGSCSLGLVDAAHRRHISSSQHSCDTSAT